MAFMFSLNLSKDQLHVEPGSSVTLTVSVTNQADTADRFELDVAGLDAEWLAIPVPAFTLAPGEEKSHKVLLKPPRAAESKSGSYPFVVSIRSLESGASIESQAILEVEPFQLTSLEIEPRRGSANYFTKQSPFSVTAINLGNVDQNLQLFADDPEDGCTYQFAQERVQLSPGQQKQILLTVQPTHFPVVGTPRLFGFGVSARGIENPHVVSSAQAQIERKALLSPAVLVAILALILIASIFYITRPTLPTMNNFSAASKEVPPGGEIILNWESSNAKRVEIIPGEGLPVAVMSNLQARGQTTINVPENIASPVSVTFRAYAYNEMGKSEPLEETVMIKKPDESPLPSIEEFSASPRTVKFGDTVNVTYRVKDAVRIQLQPVGTELPVNLSSYSFTPQSEGRVELTLVATNAEGKAARQSFSITVEVPSKAKIIAFRAMALGEPIGTKEIEPGTPVTIEWQATGGVRAEIQPGGSTVDPNSGMLEIRPDKTTEYILTVVDQEGKSTSQKIKVKVKAQPVDPGPIPPPN